MENSTKKSGGVVIPKRKRSLDLKSLYESRVSEVVEVKEKTSQKNHVEDVEKKKTSKKEVSLSSSQPGVKKSKEDVNGEKSETGSIKKSTSGNKGLHGMPLPLAENAAVFNIPKRPRGSVWRRKPESDRIPKPLILQDSQPLRLQESDDHVGPSNVNAAKSEIDSGPHEKSFNAGAVSAGNGGISKLKSPSSEGRKKLVSRKHSKPSAFPDSFDRVGPINVSVTKSKDDSGYKDLLKVVSISGGSGGVTKLQSSGKNSRPNSKSKQKADPKSTFDASGSSQKLKRKAGGDEIKQNKKFKFGSAEKEGNPDVSSGTMSSEKQRKNSSKKKDSVICRDGNDASTMKAETSVHEIEEEEDLVVIDENSSPVERQGKIKKKKDSVLGGNGKGTSKKKRGTFVGKVEEKKHDRFGAVGEEENLAVDSEHIFPEKQRRNRRKGKDLLVGGDGGEASTKKTEPSMDHTFVDFIDDDDDLEQNAARMLSSRFNPSCKGFASNKRSSKSDGFSLPVSSGRDSVNQQATNSSGFAETGSADPKSIALRPRGEDKGKQVQRQRRHFYEVLPKDFDALWAVNRRIKIFWPLDESWYHGLVKDYHPEVKLHHIKYDDRDEEWVDLQEEKFRLLLLPSEVPGKAKTRKRKRRIQDVDGIKAAAPRSDDDDSGTRNDLDSEPIASWLTRSNQRVKSSKKRISQMHPPTVFSLSVDETENRESAMENDLEGRVNGFLLGAVSSSESRNSMHLFYVRKKFRKSKERSFGPMDAKARGNTASLAPEKQLWLIDEKGNSRLNVTVMASAEFRMETHLAVLPLVEFSHETEVLWLLHCMFMLQHGTVVVTSPAVKMEMLFIDGNHGLRFLLFEGCLRQALAFISLIMVLFSRPEEQWIGNERIPVTSISFSIYGGQDLRKRHVFAFCSFAGLKRSKWLYLDYKLLQHCRLLKQLPVSECTHDNIKNLEGKRKHVTGTLTMGVSGDVFNTTFASNDLQYHAAPCSTEHPENDIQPVAEAHTHAEPSSVISQHLAPQNAASENSLEVVAQLEQDESMKDVDEHTICTDPAPNPKSGSRAGNLAVDIPSIDQIADRNVKDGFVDSPNLTGPRSQLKRGRISPVSSLGDLSPMWPDGKTNFVQNGFSSGPKKPRTRVRYSMPFSGHNIGTRQKTQNQRSLPCKRIRRASLKRLSDVSMDTAPKCTITQKNLESLACGANVLVTQGDLGWRLSGAHVVLEVADRNEWSLAVKFSGVTKYAYKVNQVLQPGSTNRYSHAMMWKGGKDWVLEFTDRNQWSLFKELHEECYNRNIRAASVKNIPIPGVRPIEENDGFGRDAPFARNSMKYFRQLQTDVEMAMDPSRVLYDMDSDDEEWLQANKKCADKGLSDDVFEKTVDVFETVSCIQQRDNFTEAEIQDMAVGVCSVEVAKLVHGHWRQKRERKGMPLIRHLQPPLWEMYQKQVKEWEQTVSRGNSAAAFSSGNQGNGLLPPPEKPPMFAFCLKPRGLDVPSRGSKQRSQRKFLVPGHHHATSGDQDGLLFGRRSGHAFGDEKMLYPSHEYADVSPSFRPSKRPFSPLNTHYSLNSDASEWTGNPTSYKNRPKKLKSYISLNNPNMMMQYKNRRNPAQQWKAGLPEMSSGQKRYYLDGKNRQFLARQMDGSDFNQFQLLEASNAEQHARKIAKLKRERAQRLMYKADLCVHKAITALMTAEAIKAAHESSNSEN